MQKIIEQISSWIKEKVDVAGCKGVVIGLSGGIDSAVVAALCRKSMNKDSVLGVIMPCGSQKEDEEDAYLVANHLDMRTDFYDLGNAFEGLSPTSLLHYDENMQLPNANLKARLRMTTLYLFANTFSYLVVGTGNKTEILVGYFTKYGDGGSDIEPIGGLYKTQVFEMARVLGLPEKIINKTPSAGLWKGQSDEEEMGVTYDELDKILKLTEGNLHQGESIDYKELCKMGKVSVEKYLKVQKMILNSQHKRRMPLIYGIE